MHTLFGNFEYHFSEFQKHTRGIISKLLRQMVYNGHGLGKRNQGILIPIVVELRFKHEFIRYDGRNNKAMEFKTIFMNSKDKEKSTL